MFSRIGNQLVSSSVTLTVFRVRVFFGAVSVAAAVFFSVVVFAGVASVAAAVVFFVLGIFIPS